MKSIYKYAAEAGLPIGLYLTCIPACFLLSLKFGVLQMLVLPLMIGFPFLLAMLMKKLAAHEPAYRRFSPLWLFGIYGVIFGTLICMLFSLSYLAFLDPSFITEYVQSSIDSLQTLPESHKYEATVDVLRKAMDSHLLPTRSQFVTSMAWFTCFAGSILSLFLALIISRTQIKKRLSMFR